MRIKLINVFGVNASKRAILAIVAFSFCLANYSRAEIEVKVDRFDGSTTVQTKITPSPLSNRPQFAVLGKYTGEAQKTNPSISIILISESEGWQYLNCHTTHWLVDDKPFELPQPIHNVHIGRGFVVEYLIILPVSLSTLQQMAAAKKIEFKVCNDEFTLYYGEMQDLRNFITIFKSPAKTDQHP